MTDLELIKEKVSDTCRCGGLKEPHKSFCQKCYFSLPVSVQRALYARPGKGYREAYEEAAEFLDGKRADA